MSDSVGPGNRRARLRHRLRQKSALRTARVAATSAAATLGFLAAVLGGWWAYSEWRLGRIELTNRGPVATVRVLGERFDEPVLEPFEVTQSHTLALPDGDYRLRIDADGRLGRTSRVAVNRGETIKHRITLEEGRLLGQEIDQFRNSRAYWWRDEPMPYARTTVALELTPGKSDLVELGGRTLLRRDGATGRVVWDAVEPASPHEPGRDPSRWIRPISRRHWFVSIVEPAVDLDGDGTRDVLLTFSEGPGFLAISGADGSMIWNHVASADGPGGPRPDGPERPGPLQPASRRANLIGEPALSDVDGDGTPDVIATISFTEFPAEIERRTGKPVTNSTPFLSQRLVQAISGRSGRRIWTSPIDPAYRSINFRTLGPAVPIRGRRSSWLGFLDRTRYLVLYPATGRPRSSPIELGFEPVRALQHADLDGDGEPDVLALGPGPAVNQQSLAAFSVATGEKLWTAAAAAPYSQPGYVGPRKLWPWLFDLDGDGQTEVIVPDSGPLLPKLAFRGVTVIDGRSGQPRWTRPMMLDNGIHVDELHHLVEAPDLDGDGVHDLVALSRSEGRNPPATRGGPRSEPVQVYADALSGRAGRLLWTWHVDLQHEKYAILWEPRWWGRGPDGWPVLGIPLGGVDPREAGPPSDPSFFHPATVHVLGASTGLEQNRVSGLSRAAVADLDGDGLPDIWGECEGQLRAYRGEPPECWRALRGVSGGNWLTPMELELKPPSDLDGDGITDVMSSDTDEATGHATGSARSGRDGHLIWKTVLQAPWFWSAGKGRSYGMTILTPPHGDLDGDGTPDVIAQRGVYNADPAGREPASFPLQAHSGRDGRLLWNAGPLRLGFEAHGDTQIVKFEPRVFGPGEPPDLLVFHRSPFAKSTAQTASPRVFAGIVEQMRIARIDGRTGRVVWDWPLEDHSSSVRFQQPEMPRLGDLDGDGRLDTALMCTPSQGTPPAEFELRAISLRDGKAIWSRGVKSTSAFNFTPSFAIAPGGESHPATVYLTEVPATPAGVEVLVHALDIRDGSIRWTWRSGVREADSGLSGGIDAINLGGKRRDAVCIACYDLRRNCRILLLDPEGREIAHRDLPPEQGSQIYFPPAGDYMIDLDGDGRDEIMLWYDHRVSAWTRDLKDLWSRPAQGWDLGHFLSGEPGRPRTMILRPMTGIESTTGRILWRYPADQNANVGLLDPGDSTRRPRVTFWQQGATVCREVLPTTPAGAILPPSGAPVPADLVPDDPRWTRPLPWVAPVRLVASPGWICALLGLALVNVVLPLGLLRLAARRRPWTLRVLMLLPVAAAIPLASYLGFEPLLPAKVDPLPPNPKLLFALATAAGMPVLVWVWFAIAALFRRRGRALGGLVLLTVVTSLVIASIWLHFDRRLMPAIEHYGRSGWLLVLVPGAYAAAVLLILGWALGSFYRWLRRPDRRATATP